MSTAPHFLLLVVCCFASLLAAEPAFTQTKVITGLVYKSGDLTPLERERCVLDLYLPEGTSYPTMVWFHGGGLIEGRWDGTKIKELARAFNRAGVAVVSAGYRLSPTVKFPTYIEDSAAAFTWVYQHIAEHGGDPRTVFLSGHSAGGYLALMVGMDRAYLAKNQLTNAAVAGIISLAGQTVTHYAVRDERGLPCEQLVVDAAAPLHHVRKDLPPILLLSAERDSPARAEENQLLFANLKAAGTPDISWLVAVDRNHGNISEWMAKPADPIAAEVLKFIRHIAAQRTIGTP